MDAQAGRRRSRLPPKEIDETSKLRIKALDGEFLGVSRVLGRHA